MSQEGRLARAMAKSGEADKLASAVETPSTASATAASSRAADAAAPAPAHTAQPAGPAPSAPRTVRRVKPPRLAPEYGIVMLSDRLSEPASQVRALRAKLLALNNGHPPRVITITSGTRREGKSTIALNLAAALSEVDPGRVLLIDGDMLQPSSHLLLHMDIAECLNDILQDPALALDNRIYETGVFNLDIIPSRPFLSSEAAEALLHQNCGRLLSILRTLYAFIIIDTPPVMAGTQAGTFGKHSDGVVLVAKMESTPRHVVKRAFDDITSAGARIVGSVLTHQRHHVPNFIYQFFGTTPANYYRYYGGKRSGAPAAEPPAASEAGEE